MRSLCTATRLYLQLTATREGLNATTKTKWGENINFFSFFFSFFKLIISPCHLYQIQNPDRILPSWLLSRSLAVLFNPSLSTVLSILSLFNNGASLSCLRTFGFILFLYVGISFTLPLLRQLLLIFQEPDYMFILLLICRFN